VLVGRDDLLALADRRLAAAAGGVGELLFFAGEAGIGKSRLLFEVERRAREAGFTVVGAGASPGDAEVAAGLLTDLAAELRREPQTAEAGARIVERLRASAAPASGPSPSSSRASVPSALPASVPSALPASGSPAPAWPASGSPASGSPATALPASGSHASEPPASGSAAFDTPPSDSPASSSPASGSPGLGPLALDRPMSDPFVFGPPASGSAEADSRLLDVAGPRGRAVGDPVPDRPGGDAEYQRRLLANDLTELIEGAADRPMLIALEDLHWADDLTLDVLARLGRRVRSLPLLLVGTYRSDELYPRVPMRAWRTRLLNQRHAEEARLGRLSHDDTAAMAFAITGVVLPADVTGAVFARSDGIPLHVEEFLATVGEVPETLADAVLIRAEQLSPPARSLAGVASVLGRSFDVDLLTVITGDSHAAVDDGLRELAERFFVRPRPDRSTYDFRHALIRDVLYADLAPHRRRDLHARAAEAAVAAGFADAFVSDQYERARLPETAHGYALTAAREAAAMSAHREAVELYRRAVRTMPAAAPPARRAELLTALAAELAAIDDNAGAADAYESAYRLHLDLNDRLAAAALVPAWIAVRHLLGAGLDERVAALRAAVALIEGMPDAATVRAGLHAALAAAYMLDRRLAEAIEDGELARSIPAADGDRAMRCNVDVTLGSVLLFAGRMDEGWELIGDAVRRAAGWRFEGQAARGYRMLATSASVLVEYPRAVRWLTEGIAYAERVERFNDRHYMAAHLGHVRWATGDWDGAVAAARHALADGRGGITTRITALHVLGYVAMGRGESDDFLREAAELGAEMRELQRASPAWWGRAETALRAGDFTGAGRWCELGYEASARVHDAAYLFPYAVTGTRAYLAQHDTTGARGWLARVSELLLERQIPGTLGAIDHAWGLIHLHEGQTGKARTCLERAAEFWSARQRFWEGTAVLVDQASCATRSRRPAEAALFLSRARDAYASVGAPRGFASAHTSAGGSSSGGPSRSGPSFSSGPSSSTSRANVPDAFVPDGSGLSARELEVARLVATGATNREIAAALTIAPKTVAAHVEHILSKLGVARRAQIAAWVATRS
jgi:DNA-binding CsgD family transcriptional regulator/tetratricopeptide (TPR) repeat protein